MAGNVAASIDSYEDGEMIFSEFEVGDAFYLIQSGQVELTKIFGSIQKTLDVLHPSEMFGEMAILENSPRSASAVATGEVKLMRFDKDNFESLMTGNPQIAMKLLKVFVKRIYDAKRRFMILKLEDRHARVADVFLMLDETAPDDDTPKTQDSRIYNTSIENIARWAGLTLAEAKDELSYFAKQNRISLRSDKIIVNNISYFSRLVSTVRAHEALRHK
jgi:CRP-like cAMP-binding protein